MSATTENPTPSIAEIWENSYDIRHCYQHALDAIERNTNPASVGWGKNTLALVDVQIKALRAQLLERCKEVKSINRNFTCLWINSGKGLVKSESKEAERQDSPETAREMSAAYAFWAWELEQRAKENETKPTS